MSIIGLIVPTVVQPKSSNAEQLLEMVWFVESSSALKKEHIFPHF